jgi:glucan 1,3-beta-glucosidase
MSLITTRANTVTFHDPNFANCAAGDAECRMAWYQRISGGSNIFIYGSGFWTFFNAYTPCSGACQVNAAEVVSDTKALYWYTLNTKSCLNMLVNNGAGIFPSLYSPSFFLYPSPDFSLPLI